ncbi:MAG: hypothetical protein RRA63_08415 [Candidatus Calescibacterium sp.]|jgi:hypothetical protein|nr:hypothetical protein [Candidatus Calescibacterium sp.]
MIKSLSKIFPILSLFLLLSCAKDKKVDVRIPIKESDIVERSFTVLDFKIFYPSWISFFVPGQKLEFKVSFFCPDFSREISASAYFIKGNERFEGSITPTSFLCLGEQDNIFQLYFPSQVTFGEYILEIIFSSSLTDEIPFYIRKNILVSAGFPGFEEFFKTWKSISYQVIQASDFAFWEEEDRVKFFAVSGNQILMFDFFPQDLTFSEPKPITSISFQAERVNLLKSGSTFYIFAHGEMAGEFESEFGSEISTAIVSVSGNDGKYLGDIPAFIPETSFRSQTSTIFMNSSCSNFLIISDQGGLSFKEFQNVLCDKYFLLKDKVFFAQGSTLYYFQENLIEPIQTEDDELKNLGSEFHMIQGENKIYVFKKFCGDAPNGATISLFSIDSDGKVEREFSIELTTCNFNFFPISNEKVLVYSRVFTELPNSLPFLSFSSFGESEKIESFDLPDYGELYFKADEENILVFSYGKDNEGRSFGAGVILDKKSGKKKFDFSGNFFGKPHDFIFQGDKLIISSISAGYLVFFSFEKSTQKQFFTSKKAESFITLKFSPDFFFAIFTDSQGCWSDRICRGSEYFFVKAGDFTMEELIFSHTFEIYQKFLGVSSRYGKLILFFKDLDRVLIFFR